MNDIYMIEEDIEDVFDDCNESGTIGSYSQTSD